MNKDEFKNEYMIEDKYVEKIYCMFNMNDEIILNSICFLMPIVNKLLYIKNNFENVLKKDIDNGNIQNLSLVMKEYKCINSMIEKGVEIDVIKDFMIEMIIKSVNILFADDDLYTKTADISYRKFFNIDQKEFTDKFIVQDLFKQLLDIFEIN